ncbi:hypothetical protein [Burkholderia stagnalis]|uniref:hypothetical protein n=1 Tax=Burkholderia stagnalis TaxID=1503054 RepID=UPI001629F1E4|nr:hypothetical protein [Burkholderia stagnalis]
MSYQAVDGQPARRSNCSRAGIGEWEKNPLRAKRLASLRNFGQFNLLEFFYLKRDDFMDLRQIRTYFFQYSK